MLNQLLKVVNRFLNVEEKKKIKIRRTVAKRRNDLKLHSMCKELNGKQIFMIH